MSRYRPYSGEEPHGTIIVKLLADEDGPRAFIRQVRDPGDPAESAIEDSEEMPVPEALALARNKAENMASPPDIFIEMGPGTHWDARWGDLEPVPENSPPDSGPLR